MKNPFYDTSHPVAVAVEPLRADAVARAKQVAEKMVEEVRANLAANNNDREIIAPYPRSSGISMAEYWQKKAYYTLVHSITVAAPSDRYRSFHDPDPVVMSPEGIAKFIKTAMEDAEAQYTAFICKLVGKIGKCERAELEGSHVWGFSILTVEKAGGSERWQTRQIINVSKLGKLFHQWPSRKIK